MGNPLIVRSLRLPLIQGIPTVLELNDEWSIPDTDLPYLVYGPLIQGATLMVPVVPNQTLIVTARDACHADGVANNVI